MLMKYRLLNKLYPSEYFNVFMLTLMKYLSILFLVIGSLSGCRSVEEYTASTGSKVNSHTIHVVKHGWHTSIVLKKSDIDTLFPKLSRFFPNAHYLDISWGDKKYFMAPTGTAPLAVRAVLFPTNSVVRVLEYPGRLKSYFSQENMQTVRLSGSELQRMISFIKNTFKRNGDNRLMPVDNEAAFFLGDQKYWGLRTCNVWVARALKKGGLSITPVFAFSANQVLRKVKLEVGK